MSNRKSIRAIILFLSIVMVVWAGLNAVPTAGIIRTPKTGVGGSAGNVFDLRPFDFANHIQAIEEMTEWESWPEKLYVPEDFEKGTVGAGQVLYQPDYERIQYATHRLTLLLTPNETYGISMKSCDYSMRLFVDGEQVALVGVPGETKEETVPRVNEICYYFKPRGERVEIIVQAANFVHNDGSQPPKIYIGSQRNIERKLQADSFMSHMIIGCLLTSALYHVALFLMNRGRKTELIFSACCLLLMLLTSKIIPIFVPEYNWYIVFRLEYLVHYATFGMITLLFDSLLPELLNKRVTRTFYAICGAFSMTVLVFDTALFSALIRYFYPVSISMTLYVLTRMAMALKSCRAQNLLAFIGLLVIGVLAVNDILYHNNVPVIGPVWGMRFTAPVGMVFFIFCYALLLAMKYAETENRKREYAEEAAMLEQTMKVREDMVRAFSHEIRTPLAVMATYTEMAVEQIQKGNINEQTLSGLAVISDEALRLGELAGHMLEGIKATGKAPKSQLARPIDIARIARQLVRLLEPAAAQDGRKIEFQLNRRLITVCKEDEITQLLWNLLDNAMKHAQHGDILVDGNENDAYVYIIIADNGDGIPAEVLPHVFERGVSGNGGSGLGLAIANEIAQKNGGKLLVESEYGCGATVTVLLPVHKTGGGVQGE